MKSNMILLNSDATAGGGGAADGGAAGGQGAGAGGQAAGGAQPATASQPTTAEKLWGVTKESQKPADSGAGQAGAKTPGGEASGGAAAGKSGSAAAPSTQQPAAGAEPRRIELTEELLTQMGKNIGESVAGAMKPPEAQPTMTQEQFDKMFKIFRPTTEQWQALRGDDEQAALGALTEMLQGGSTQAVTIATHLLTHEMEQMRQQFAPAMKMAQERELEALKVEFFKQNEDLKGMDPLLELVRDQFVAKGMKFKSKDEAFKAVADAARAQIEKIPGLKNGIANIPANNGGGQGTGQPGTKMPALSGGKGQTGAGDGGASSGSAGRKSTAERIFG